MPDFPKASSNFVPDSPGGYSDNTASAAARAEGQLNGHPTGQPTGQLTGHLDGKPTGRADGVAAAATAAIAVSGLAKRVADASGELTILHEVDFTVQRAETLAIVGASGSGKSTLLGLLAGLDTPSAGKVVLDGVDIYALDEDGRAALRKEKLGFVFQSFQLLAHLTAVENVMLPLELSGATHARERAEAMLDRVGLASRLKHYPKYLSGGEQQRVALARAFVTEPPLLFADEPTGSLDATTGESVIKLMFELNRQHGSTLVLVTHDQSMAARCGRTITIAAGRLV